MLNSSLSGRSRQPKRSLFNIIISLSQSSFTFTGSCSSRIACSQSNSHLSPLCNTAQCSQSVGSLALTAVVWTLEGEGEVLVFVHDSLSPSSLPLSFAPFLQVCFAITATASAAATLLRAICRAFSSLFFVSCLSLLSL